MCTKNVRSYTQTKLFLLYLLIAHCVKYGYCECNGLSQTKAKIKVDGKYEDVDLGGCLEGSPYEEIWITSCVENIPEDTFKNMPNLKTLVIEAGNLNFISSNFTSNTPSLRYISINKNALENIGIDVFPKTPLERLDLASNRIRSIEADSLKDMRIELLKLDDNKLKNIEPRWFYNSSIAHISLTRNQINYVQGNAFKGIKGLKEINLSYNYINYIDNNAFVYLKALRNLNLTGNMLTHLKFLDDIKLTKLDVGFNRISYIFLSNNTRIQYFFVFPNPWQCNCLQEFWKFAVAQNIGVGNTPSTKSTWREVYPVCVAINPTCTMEENYDDIRLQFFKNVNYAKLDN